MMLVDQFARVVDASPDRVALDIEGNSFTYRELWSAATHLAARLSERGIGRNDRVCLMMEKSFDLYAATWGVWLAGAAYVPLAPSFPVARLRAIVERARPSLVWFASEPAWQPIAEGLSVPAEQTPRLDIAAGPTSFDRAALTSSDLAYVLFTSGSTGTPKGVMVNHGNVNAFVRWAAEFFGVTADDRLSGHSDLTFDLSVFDTFVAHCSGACLVPVIKALDRSAPGAFIRSRAIDIWFSVPSVLSGAIALGDLTADNLSGVRWMAFCGEPLLPGPVRQLMSVAPAVRVANLYGPTEATVACAAYELTSPPSEEAVAVPFGWRTGQTEVVVWSDQNRQATEGERGELYIVGDQVGPGYFGDPVETDKRFVADPRGGSAPCFKSGDLVTVWQDGPVFNMRLDHQVKFRGWRIELGDIERALAGVHDVLECAAALIRRDAKPDALVAFVRSARPVTAPALLAQLRSVLPDYMIPTHVRVVADFPRTHNDKIDRARLAELL